MARQRWQRGEIGARIEAASRPPPRWDAGADWSLLPVALAYLACFALMTWPWLLGRVTIPWDAKAHFQPQIQFLADSLARGETPWWNPFVFSGQPQVADPQSMIFSPPFLALALLNRAPSLWAVDVTVLATMAIGGIGLIAWARDQRWHWAGALIAALGFSFGAAMGWRLQHTGQVLSLAYLPWALLFLERAMLRGSLGYGVLAGMAGAAIVLGRDQVALLCVYLLAARVLWLWASADERGALLRRSLLPLTAGGIVGLTLIAVPVLMTLLLAADSNRPSIDFEGAGRGSLHPANLITFVVPQLFGAAGAMAEYWGPPSFAWNDTGLFTAQNVGQLYIGAVPVLLLLIGLFSGHLVDREARFFSIAFVVMLLYGLGWYTPAFRAMYEVLPGVKLYRRPADAVFLIGALGAILAGYVTHRLFTTPWQRPRDGVWLGVLVALLAAFGLAVVFGVRLDRVGRLPTPLALAAGLFAVGAIALWLALGRAAASPIQAAALLAICTAADIGWNNGPTTSSSLPPAHYEAMQPKTANDTVAFLKNSVVADATRRDRIELAGLGFHWPNVSMTHRLENTLGYNPVRLGAYSRATGAEDHVGLPDQRKFSKLMPSYNSPLSQMLGLRWIATGAPIESMDKTLAPNPFRLAARTRGAYIYENTSTLPRVLFVGETRSADFDAIVATGVWPQFNPRQTVLLEHSPLLTADRRPGHVTIVSYRNSEVVLDVDSPDGGAVVLNDIWHPWWFAEVDGLPVACLKANVLFRGVVVPPGRHTVTFKFKPIDGLLKAVRVPGLH
ncbi:MAG: hypothetical protein ACKVP7_16585 [Hyphomicrobiaceae bacterium]